VNPVQRSPYTQPTFLAAVAILLSAAVGLNLAVAKLQLHFRKAPVPLARPLAQIAPRLGDWIQVSRDEPLEADTQEVLGTNQYIFRDYISLSAHGGHCAAGLIQALHLGEPQDRLDQLGSRYLEAAPADQLKMLESELADKSTEQRKTALAMVQRQFPDAVVNMAVTYYTGLADTVAHIPDRCYIADGFEPSEYTEPTWTIPGRADPLSVRFINFQDAGDSARPDRSVAYFFHVNGEYKSDPEAVRLRMQNLFQKFGYYAKVELMTMDPDHERSAQTMTAFLGDSLSEVEKCFPDWSKYTSVSAEQAAGASPSVRR